MQAYYSRTLWGSALGPQTSRGSQILTNCGLTLSTASSSSSSFKLSLN